MMSVLPKDDNSQEEHTSLGLAPAVLAKCDLVKPKYWCPPIPDIEFDPWCDPDNPKTTVYKDILKAARVIKNEIPETPLIKCQNCERFKLEIYCKIESFHRTGSFHERGALYALLRLNEEQRKNGVITASLGNWAMSLAYHGQKLKIPVTVVLPKSVMQGTVTNCQGYGASVVLFGNDFAEAKRHAFTLRANGNMTYINGDDHPHTIAAAGIIGFEILRQLPHTDAILVPVGGGGLIAGVATAVKRRKPEVLIYGIQPKKSKCFYEAMEKGKPYMTNIVQSVASTLAMSTAGHNAFHTAKSLIDKMVLVDDDLISQAILHLLEEQKLIVEGAGALSLSAFFALPNVLPELREKTVVCIISGGNIDAVTLPKTLERAKAVEGRIIKLKVTLPADETQEASKILTIIANIGCNVLHCNIEHGWLTDNYFYNIYLTLTCETLNIRHACTLKRVMQKLFPCICEFEEEPYNPAPYCACFPKRVL